MEHQFIYKYLNKNSTGLLHKEDTVNHIHMFLKNFIYNLIWFNETAIRPFDGRLGMLINKE